MAYKEGNHSHLVHLGRQYRVDDLIELTKNKPVYNLPVEQLIWIFDYSTPDEARVLRADLKVPIIVIEEKLENGAELVVLDGLHRVAKAVRLKKSTILARLITPTELKTLKER